MTAHVPPPLAVDLLGQAIDILRRQLATPAPLKVRIRIFWAGAKLARSLASNDVFSEEFTRLADEIGLTASFEHHGAEDIAHVVSWAWRGWNPFETGPLK
jgi:hypothetical protein